MVWLLATMAFAVDSGPWLDRPDRDFAVALSAEIGFLAPLRHTIQLSNDGTDFDYVRDGGQNNLFPFLRPKATLYAGASRRLAVTFLYQPLNLRTTEVARGPLRFDKTTFPGGTPVDFRYGFDFYRGSVAWDVLPGDATLEIGGAIQIRNATIDFTSADGTRRVTNRDVGIVPLFEVNGRWDGDDLWAGFEFDGIYAPIKWLNGNNVDVTGALVDASLRVGLTGEAIQPFVNVRWLGGGAEGTNPRADPPSDGYVSNWLHFGTVSIGAIVR